MEETITTARTSTRRISIQGIAGCFHHVAANKFFHDDFEIEPSMSFDKSLQNVKEERTDYAIIAIENSIAGSILPNYELLRKSGLTITGEISIHIEQHLMALSGQNLEDIREVHSHPMAIHQCKEFLNAFPDIKLVESEDTAFSAKQIADKEFRGIAAIASDLAAKKYGLEIICRGIESHKDNYTRFLIVSTARNKDGISNKASVYFQTAHKAGSLAKTLTVIASHGINLSKIQSHPVPSRNILYGFYADLEIKDEDHLNMVLEEMKEYTTLVEVLGIYERGVDND